MLTGLADERAGLAAVAAGAQDYLEEAQHEHLLFPCGQRGDERLDREIIVDALEGCVLGAAWSLRPASGGPSRPAFRSRSSRRRPRQPLAVWPGGVWVCPD
ncbi:hypothetical protein IU451_29775 [Nocardia cyriacigeorgica]|uniref:hypothetical protein n=1 Tax=Nocardia cyriacigeorgica TaxID=135487 RepID=UPI0018960786|nr:hypothetical protein [Nocardia cyriacigeorgica]MBF6326691.1 hypothetical protein [Nocardia cyriacigeorgica]